MISTNRTAEKIVRAGLLALLMLGYASVMPLHAQEAPAFPERKQATENSAEQPGGPGRQLAHESREAAGEEKDEMAEFKQSASVREIAKLTGLNLQQSYWLSVRIELRGDRGRHRLGGAQVSAGHVPRPQRRHPEGHAGSADGQRGSAAAGWPTSSRA